MTTIRRAWGRDYVPDDRDLRYRLRPAVSRRSRRTWRLGPVTDQGAMPSCVGHAWAGWLAASPVRQRPIVPDGLYELAQHYDEWQGTDYEGTSVRGAAKLLRVTGHILEYQWAWEIDRALNHALETGPLVLGCNWYAGMVEPDEQGFIRPTGKLLGGHAVLIYSMDAKIGRAGIRNSWGPDWGEAGNCLLALEELERLLGEDGECATATEARPG